MTCAAIALDWRASTACGTADAWSRAEARSSSEVVLTLLIIIGVGASRRVSTINVGWAAFEGSIGAIVGATHDPTTTSER